MLLGENPTKDVEIGLFNFMLCRVINIFSIHIYLQTTYIYIYVIYNILTNYLVCPSSYINHMKGKQVNLATN